MGRFKVISVVFFIILASGGIAGTDDCAKAVALYNQGTLSRNFDEREKLFMEALALPCADPQILARIRNNLGDTYENTGRLKEAIGEYKKATELLPDLPTPYISLGDVYAKMGRHNEAGKYYGRYWRLASFKTRGQITEDLSLKSSQRSVAPVPRTDLYFGFNEAILTEASHRQLQELLAAVSGKELRAYAFDLSGHTCDIGTDAYNLGLSEKRANAVRKWLADHKYPSGQLSTKGFGKKNPVADNGTEEGKKLNRRVEIRTTGAVLAKRRSTSGGMDSFARGKSLSREGKYSEAVSYYEKALDMFKKEQSRDEVEAVLVNLYLTYLAMGNMEKALWCRGELARSDSP